MVTKLTKLIENSNISIDSLQVRIPLIVCDLHHTDLKDLKYIVSVDGEQIGKIEPNKHLSSYTGITVVYRIRKVSAWNRNTGKNYQVPSLCIGIPSKVLKSSYLEGITATNLENVYEYIDSLKIASFDYSVFKSSLSTDIDWKCDFDISELDYYNFDEFTKDLSLIAKETNERKLGFNRFKEATNKGIEFQTRSNTYKSIVNPFLKFYSKRLQMLSDKSREFTDTYLTGQHIRDCRIEATTKDKKHLKSLGIKDSSLINLVSLDKQQKEKILLNAINRNLTGRQITRNSKDISKLTYFEKMYILSVRNPCMSIDQLAALYESSFSGKKDRFKAREKIEKLKPYI